MINALFNYIAGWYFKLLILMTILLLTFELTGSIKPCSDPKKQLIEDYFPAKRLACKAYKYIKQKYSGVVK